MLVALTNANLMEFQVAYLTLFRYFTVMHGFGGFWMERFLQVYPVVGFPPVSIRGSAIFLLYIDDIVDDVMCKITIYADDTTHYS